MKFKLMSLLYVVLKNAFIFNCLYKQVYVYHSHNICGRPISEKKNLWKILNTVTIFSNETSE